eukprot:6213952-Pleurochrysis_carterae.AAC.2
MQATNPLRVLAPAAASFLLLAAATRCRLLATPLKECPLYPAHRLLVLVLPIPISMLMLMRVLTNADANAHVTPAPSSAGRHATTYELKCVCLRQKIDTQRNIINKLAVDLDKNTTKNDNKHMRALRERDYVKQEAASQQAGLQQHLQLRKHMQLTRKTSRSSRRMLYKVKHKALLTKMKDNRDASSDKATGLEAKQHRAAAQAKWRQCCSPRCKRGGHRGRL